MGIGSQPFAKMLKYSVIEVFFKIQEEKWHTI